LKRCGTFYPYAIELNSYGKDHKTIDGEEFGKRINALLKESNEFEKFII
jgi:hypothetical protein